MVLINCSPSQDSEITHVQTVHSVIKNWRSPVQLSLICFLFLVANGPHRHIQKAIRRMSVSGNWEFLPFQDRIPYLHVIKRFIFIFPRHTKILLLSERKYGRITCAKRYICHSKTETYVKIKRETEYVQVFTGICTDMRQCCNPEAKSFWGHKAHRQNRDQ